MKGTEARDTEPREGFNQVPGDQDQAGNDGVWWDSCEDKNAYEIRYNMRTGKGDISSAACTVPFDALCDGRGLRIAKQVQNFHSVL